MFSKINQQSVCLYAKLYLYYNFAFMINYNSQYQTKIAEFSNLYNLKLDENNRWIQLGSILPWDKMISLFSKKYSFTQGSKGVDFRVIIGALIVKHKLTLTDEETIEIIRENPYIQFF